MQATLTGHHSPITTMWLPVTENLPFISHSSVNKGKYHHHLTTTISFLTFKISAVVSSYPLFPLTSKGIRMMKRTLFQTRLRLCLTRCRRNIRSRWYKCQTEHSIIWSNIALILAYQKLMNISHLRNLLSCDTHTYSLFFQIISKLSSIHEYVNLLLMIAARQGRATWWRYLKESSSVHTITIYEGRKFWK